MKTKTLFNAYISAEKFKWYAVDQRKSSFGIAVFNDRYSREWQRYERLSLKLRNKILDRLEAQP